PPTPRRSGMNTFLFRPHPPHLSEEGNSLRELKFIHTYIDRRYSAFVVSNGFSTTRNSKLRIQNSRSKQQFQRELDLSRTSGASPRKRPCGRKRRFPIRRTREDLAGGIV